VTTAEHYDGDQCLDVSRRVTLAFLKKETQDSLRNDVRQQFIADGVPRGCCHLCKAHFAPVAAAP